MKNKWLLAFGLVSASAFVVSAQTTATVVYEAKLENKKVPVAVVEQVQKDFPNARLEETYLLPAQLYEQNWVVVQKNQPQQPVDYYEVRLSGKNVHSSAVYSPQGELLNSREVLKDAPLPPVVGRTLVTQYPGWTERRNKEVIKNGRKEVVHYIVFLKKGWREERVVLNPQGEIEHRFTL